MGSRRGKGLTLNRTEMADYLGIGMPTLDDWVRRGCPVVRRGGRGRAWAFNSADVLAWRESDIRAEAQASTADATVEELRRRKLRAETEQAELDLAKAKAQVVPIEQFDRALAKAFGEVRANLRNVLPGRAARRLLGETNETRIKAVLLEEVDQMLEVLHDSDLILEEDLAMADDDADDEDFEE